MVAWTRKPNVDKDQRGTYSDREQTLLAHNKMFSYHINPIFILSMITEYFISLFFFSPWRRRLELT